MPKKLQRRGAAPRPAAAAPAPQKQDRPGGRSGLFGGQRITPRVLTEFTNQLAVLLNAGIPVTRCLRILEGQFPQGAMRRATHSLVEEVESGTSLSEAMTKHPAVFDDLYTNMVRAGEAGGVQEEILGRLADFMEKSESIRARVKGALAYPIAILAVMILVLTIVFIFVIPKFQTIFTKLLGDDAVMHWTTETVMAMGEHLEVYWWLWVLAVAGVYGLHRLLLARVEGYLRFRDALVLRIPFFGNLVRKNLIGRFARTFGTLIQSGVPHLDALEIVGASLSNVHMKDAVRGIHASIREGAGIAVPMGESGMFNDIVINMVDVGEQTGELDRMLQKIADRYEIEVDRSVDAIFKVIEPILLVIMAVVVGFVVFALFSPLLKLMEGLQR